MIKVNLGAKKGSVIASSGSAMGGQLAGRLSSLSLSDLSPEKKAMIVTGVIYGAIIFGANYFLSQIQTQEFESIRVETTELESKIKLADSEIGKTSGFEKLKKDLEADEKLIRTKIETIQKLVNERSTPPKILIALSNATPKDVWLSSFAIKEQQVTIQGKALGIQVVSDFMRGLEETIYFKEVVLKGSKQTKEQGKEVATFDLEAKRR